VNNLLNALKKIDDENNAPEREEYVTAPEAPSDIDWNKIKEFEGGSQQEGYVPDAGQSGVTVGTGLDVGQRSHLEGLAPEIQQKLQPFVGLKNESAKRKLASSGGIDLTPEEVQQVDSFAKNETEQKVKDYWQKNSDMPFESLSPSQKTVLASVMHQYGNFANTPRLANYAIKGHWPKVVSELRNFKDEYPTRRNREADILEQELNNYRKMKK
jgi:GH24 family phage-related lysozyme (muramidase)